MPSADHAVAGPGPTRQTAVDLTRTRPVGAHRPADDADRVRTTQRWAVGVLTLATTVLAAHLLLLVVAVGLVVSALDAVTSRQTGGLDVVALLGDVASGLLVGWCTGLATAAVVARGEALGARLAGVAAGAVGATAGAAVLAMTGVL